MSTTEELLAELVLQTKANTEELRKLTAASNESRTEMKKMQNDIEGLNSFQMQTSKKIDDINQDWIKLANLENSDKDMNERLQKIEAKVEEHLEIKHLSELEVVEHSEIETLTQGLQQEIAKRFDDHKEDNRKESQRFVDHICSKFEQLSAELKGKTSAQVAATANTAHSTAGGSQATTTPRPPLDRDKGKQSVPLSTRFPVPPPHSPSPSQVPTHTTQPSSQAARRQSIVKGIFTPQAQQPDDDEDPARNTNTGDGQSRSWRGMFASGGSGGSGGGDGGGDAGGGLGGTRNSSHPGPNVFSRFSMNISDPLAKLVLADLTPTAILSFLDTVMSAARRHIMKREMDSYLSADVKASLAAHVIANTHIFDPDRYVTGDMDIICSDDDCQALLLHYMRPQDRPDFLDKLSMVAYVQRPNQSTTLAEVSSTRTYALRFAKMYTALIDTFELEELRPVHPPWNEKDKGIVNLLMSTAPPSINSHFLSNYEKHERNSIKDIGTLTNTVFALCDDLESFEKKRLSLRRNAVIAPDSVRGVTRQDDRTGNRQANHTNHDRSSSQATGSYNKLAQRPSTFASRPATTQLRMVNMQEAEGQGEEEEKEEQDTDAVEEYQSTQDGMDMHPHVYDFRDEQQREDDDAQEDGNNTSTLYMMGGSSKSQSSVKLPCFAEAFGKGCPLGNSCPKSHDPADLRKAAADRWDELRRSRYFVRPKDEVRDARVKGSVEVTGNNQQPQRQTGAGPRTQQSC